MKVALTIICILFTNLLYSQEEIKKLIYSDFVSLNENYNFTLVPEKGKYLVIYEKDTIDESYTWNEIKTQYQNVNIISIDSFNNFYAVKVNYKKLQSNCYGLFNPNNQFLYILYKDKTHYLKIDGFMTSEIMTLDGDDLNKLKSFAEKLKGEEKRFKKVVKTAWKNRIEDTRKSLRISIIYSLNKTLPNINYYPYLVDSSIWVNCNTVD